MIGKNVTRTTTRIFGRNPKPNQTTTSGAIATIGIVWDPTSSGADRPADDVAAVHRDRRADRRRTIETANPTSVSATVGTVWPAASPRNSHSDVQDARRRRQDERAHARDRA